MADQHNEVLLEREPRRSSNGKALKVTGLTVLACLLLAGQALTAYFVWGQKQHITTLTESQEQLKNELTRKTSAGAPKVMRLPMNSMPLLKDFSDETTDQKQPRVPLTKLRPSFLNQREGSGVFDAVELESRCQLESMKQVRPGFYQPQCDEQGNFLPMQCWHSTGYCWCVDNNGNEIKGTRTRGRPTCGPEGRVSVQKNQERLTHIRQLREHLHKESDQSGCSTSTVEHEKLLERRMRERETHERLIEEELMKMERELEEQQVEGVEGEMFYLRGERSILVLQVEALRRENQQAHRDLETQYIQHQHQLNTVREESLRVFRTFREVLEEQKRSSEGRYRTLLIDAIQDAVHLSNKNLQLQEELQQLRNCETLHICPFHLTISI
ncbi:H-2 class II histocompatibility antigen gamma chain Ia antigen-associated invariant chain [Triplophysa tibetana]|uniref:H-2 class II histocompatibility antigen gamma chain Ia antigen-associated invariant chain n=1 Tax=Triplophysa tibetana TaxID=1572043 RepID=A0A5A9NKB1_9TELE|nr:H-2 class II histocompatibility antigen gamma chain Ia antigen-associated invariant chain [Triplophysa tibetana]